MAQYDEMTPYELALAAEVYVEKAEAEMQEKITMVWLGEYYHRIKKLPTLQEVLKKITAKEKQTMTDEEMLLMVKKLNAQFGGTVEAKNNKEIPSEK